MSWSTKRFFGFLAGAAIAGSVLVGCAGTSTLPIDNGTPVIPGDGELVQVRGTSNSDVTPQAAPQQVQVTLDDGRVVSASLPSNTSLAAGQPVAVFEDSGNPIIDGLTVESGSAAPGSRSPGDITVYMFGVSDPHDTGVVVTRLGRLSGRICCPDGHFTIFFEGPFAIVRGGNRLDVRNMVFNTWVRNGRAALPTHLHGDLPVNGGSSFPLQLGVDIPNVFSNGFNTLKVTHENGILQQTQRVDASGHVLFHDFVFSDNSRIPAVGLNTVEFSYDDTHP
jgi:hypothetical protein